MSGNVTALRTRRPTGRAGWPLILVEGEEKSGATGLALHLAADPRIAQVWAMDLGGRGVLDEFGDFGFDIIDLDGTWHDFLDQLDAATAAAEEIAAEGGVAALVLDEFGTGEWGALMSWVKTRARRANRPQLARNPDLEYRVSGNLWDDADVRHAAVMRRLRAFPGPVVLTSHGRWITATGKDGELIRDAREYKIDGHRQLAATVNAWVQTSRDADPRVVGVNGPRWDGAQPAEHEENILGWLVFDVLGCEPGVTTVRRGVTLDADEVLPGEEITTPETPQQERGPRRIHRPTPTQREDAAETARKAATGVDALASADSLAAAEHVSRVAHESTARDVNVSGLLEPYAKFRDDLGVPAGVEVTLASLAKRVVAYWKKHGTAPGAPAAAEDTTEEAAAAETVEQSGQEEQPAQEARVA